MKSCGSGGGRRELGRGLFGGALLGAGLLAGGAGAGEVEFQSTLGVILGAPFGAPLVLINPSTDGPFGSETFESGAFSAAIEASAGEVSFEHERAPGAPGWGYTLAGVDASFIALEDFDVRVSWDFGAWLLPGGETNLLRLRDETGGLTLISASALLGPRIGSQTIRLREGREYSFFTSTQGVVGGGPSFARLDLDPQPLIGAQPGSVALEAGGEATLSVGGSRSTGMTYRWERNGAPLADDGRIEGAGSPTLIVRSVRLSDAGEYRCVVSDGVHEEMSDAAVVAVMPCIEGDLNGDGAVGFSDLNALLVTFGARCGPE